MSKLMKIALQDIQPLTAFQRNAKAHLAKVNRSGRHEVLTVNGKAEAVLMGKKAYVQLMEAVEELKTMKSLREGLADLDAGRLIPAEQVHAKLRAL